MESKSESRLLGRFSRFTFSEFLSEVATCICIRSLRPDDGRLARFFAAIGDTVFSKFSLLGLSGLVIRGLVPRRALGGVHGPDIELRPVPSDTEMLLDMSDMELRPATASDIESRPGRSPADIELRRDWSAFRRSSSLLGRSASWRWDSCESLEGLQEERINNDGVTGARENRKTDCFCTTHTLDGRRSLGLSSISSRMSPASRASKNF